MKVDGDGQTDVHRQSVFENIRNYVNVPSVQMQAVPDVSIGQALGMSRAVRIKPDDPDDEVDERIRGQFSAPPPITSPYCVLPRHHRTQTLL
jgi:hypothetical protein